MLIGLGYSEEEAEFLLAIELGIRKTEDSEEKVEPERVLTKSEILRSYRYALIDRETALDLLIGLNYTEAEASFLLDLEDRIRMREWRDRKARAILRLFRLGIKDYKTAQAELLNLDYPLDYVNLLLEIEQDRAEAEIKELSVSVLADLVKGGFIPYEKWIEMMEGIGYTSEMAHLYLSVRGLKITPAMIADAYRRGMIPLYVAITLLRRHGYAEWEAMFILRLYWKRMKKPIVPPPS